MMIIRKTLLALTGLFICFFLIAHLGANFILLLPAPKAHDLYNSYSSFLRHNFLILIVAYFNYACILGHVILSIVITIKNRRSKGSIKGKNASLENSSWTSQNMGLLGTILLTFIVIHMANFWFKVKFSGEEHDLYVMVISLFSSPGYVLIYFLAMLPLGLHLAHGVESGFRSIGLYHKKYLRGIARIGVAYAWFTAIGFAIIPVIIYFRQETL